VDQSSPNFFIKRGRAAVDHLIFKFSFCRSIPEIFALKFQSYQKSRRILDVFICPPKFCWGHPFQKFRAGLTIKHGTHVRMAPGWKGAPERHAAKFLSMPLSLRCRWRTFCRNFVTRKSTKATGSPPLSVAERLSRSH